MLRIGLTGGIACGKTHVRRRLAAAGCATLDLDLLAHELLAPGQPAFEAVVKAFGPRILGSSGAIDRQALGAHVFSDPEARAKLNAIVHPLVRAEEARRALATEAEGQRVLVTDAALLVESGYHLRFDRLVVVHCRPDQQVARLRARDGLSEEDARARVAAQMPVETKRRFAHFDLDASFAVAQTEAAADALARTLLGLGGAAGPVRVSRTRAEGALVHGPARGPHGLSPRDLAGHLAQAGGLDLPALARRLDPPAAGPWYEAAAGRPHDVEPAVLLAPLVLYEIGKRGHDPERLAAAAHSLAWLTDRAPGRLAGAVLLALLLGEIAERGGLPPDLEERLRTLLEPARRWGRGEPDPSVMSAARAAARHPRDPEAASQACAALGAEPGLAGMLVGLAVGAAQESAGAEYEFFLDALGASPDHSRGRATSPSE